MRWESLFADLEGQLAAATAQDLRDEVAELTRAETAQVTLVDRVRAAGGARLRVLLRDGQTVDGELADVAPQWLLLAPDPYRRALVPAAAVAGVVGLTRYVAPPAGVAERTLSLGHALRALARDRAAVRLDVAGASLPGRIERVGADHLDLAPAEHTGPGGWTVAFSALVVVRSG